ncbi:reverse transcriptase domain-containing protein [Tanacetum coccineum]
MPKYAEFLKGLVSNKTRLEEACTVRMNERCSAVLLNKLPSKEKDPGSFTIPCDIGHLHIDNALADLVASISLMPYTMYEKLGLGEPKPTRMSLELVDRSIQYPRGIAEDCDSDSETPIRRIKPINTPYSQETQGHNRTQNEHLYSASAIEIDKKIPELKDLPSHLEYAYLKGDKSCPIIISSKLTKKEKVLLLRVLEKRKGAIAWKMSDIKEISPSFCTHKILMEESFKPVIHPQKRLNPKVQDVVKNEIVKLLDSGLIYPISDSPWEDVVRTMQRPDKMLGRCEETNLVLNWEKCHFMVKEGIILGHKIYGKGIEVDKAKIDVIAKLPYLTNVKGVRSFLGHAGFYRRFIKYLSMISKVMTQLLMKDAKFDFYKECKKALNKLKENLTTVPIIISPDWSMPFELMCDTSDFEVGSVLGQRIDGKFKPIYYASKTLNDARAHYTTTEKELLAVVLLLQGFNIEIKDKKGAENLAADHLSRLENPNIGEFAEEEIKDKFPDEHLMILKAKLNYEEPWYADYVNYIVGKVVPLEWKPKKKKLFFSQVKNYFWDEPYAFRLCPGNVMRRCVAGSEILKILAYWHCGPTGGHHSTSIIGRKVYEAGFYWPNIFRDAKDYVMKCDACQKSRNISS